MRKKLDNYFHAKLILLCLLISLTNTLSFAQKIELEYELVARYLFEGDARNEVEDANHGLETSVQYETDRYGMVNSCVYMTGNNSYITIPHTEDLNWDARSESYSICFWVKSPDPTGGVSTSRRILSKWNEILPESYPFSFQYYLEDMHANIYEPNAGPLSCTFTDTWDGEWQHVAMIYSHETNSLSSYLNGQFVISKTKVFNNTTSNNADIRIGHTLTPQVEGFYRGHFDDLYFYNRAIEACEVEALFSGQLLQER